jgi:hypothetical protein
MTEDPEPYRRPNRDTPLPAATYGRKPKEWEGWKPPKPSLDELDNSPEIR